MAAPGPAHAAPPATAPRQVTPILDVRTFGAVLDGKTDDAAAIQKAITALPATGGTVLVPGPAAIGSAGILLSRRSNIHLVGVGPTAGLKAVAVAPGNEPAMLFISRCTDSTLESLRIDGNRLHTQPVSITGCTRFTVSGNTFRNANMHAALFTTANRSNQYLNNTVDGTISPTRGFWIGNVQANMADLNPLIAGNVIINCGATALGGTAVGARIVNNTLNHNAGAGIALGGADGAHYSDSVISGNTCNDNGFQGIQADSWSDANPIDNILLTDNTCNGNRHSGIYADKARNWTIANNTCNDNVDAGIYVACANSVTVVGNHCSDTRPVGSKTQYSGMMVEAWNPAGSCIAIDIIANDFSSNLRNGLQIVNSANPDAGLVSVVRVVNNNLSNNLGYGIFAWQVRAGTLTGFSSSGNSYSGNVSGTYSTNIGLSF